MRGVVEASKKLQFSDDPEFEEEYALPKLSKPTFDLSPNEKEERLEGFRLDASWEEEERGKEMHILMDLESSPFRLSLPRRV